LELEINDKYLCGTFIVSFMEPRNQMVAVRAFLIIHVSFRLTPLNLPIQQEYNKTDVAAVPAEDGWPTFRRK
jgi:hypothetical protein